MSETNNNILVDKEIEILNFLKDISIESIQKDIIEGLSNANKYISPKYFYNKKGSDLFEKITKLEEYYPSRTEMLILSSLFNKIDIDFEHLDIIELGSGDSSKIKLLLNQIDYDLLKTINYFPVDISYFAIEKSVNELNKIYNLNSIRGIVSDFHLQLNKIPARNKRLFCFLGSTIGNFSDNQMQTFMQGLGKQMQIGDSLILGMDMVKDIDILESAYNDKKGVTAEFNLNVLDAVNKVILSDFNQDEFEHYAFFNKEKSRIEMHLKALKDIEVNSTLFQKPISIKKGECIHTENSHKFNDQKLAQLTQWAGLKQKSIYADSKSWFNIVHFVK